MATAEEREKDREQEFREKYIPLFGIIMSVAVIGLFVVLLFKSSVQGRLHVEKLYELGEICLTRGMVINFPRDIYHLF